MKYKHPDGVDVPYVIVSGGNVHATADTLDQAQKIVDMKRSGRDGLYTRRGTYRRRWQPI